MNNLVSYPRITSISSEWGTFIKIDLHRKELYSQSIINATITFYFQ